MWPNPQFFADLVTFAGEFLDGKLHFLCGVNSRHYLIMKVNNKRELQNIAINLSADFDYKDFMKICRKCIKEPYSFLTIDTALPASHSLTFRKNVLVPL